MLKIPIENIAEDNISIKKESIIFKIQGKGKLYKIPATEILYYYSDISGIENKEDKIKMVHYLLTNASSGLKGFGKGYHRQIAPMLKRVEANHDPFPDHKLRLFLYGSLQSIQWHLVSHGIADYWMNPDNPYLTSGIIPEDKMESVWDGFIDQVQCERWDIKDLPLNGRVREKEWKKRRKELEKKFGIPGLQGCYNCINEQGAERFIKCCDFFEKYRIQYLKKLKEWINDTIQDNYLVNSYAKGRDILPVGKVSARRHFHTTNKGAGELHAYVIEQEKDGETPVYLMKFRLAPANAADISKYTLKTVYGIISKDSCEEAKTFINQSVKQKVLKLNLKRNDFCHITNWDAII